MARVSEPEATGQGKSSRQGKSIAQKPVEWDVAVRAAGVLLDKRYGPSGSTENPAMRGMAEDLAARLCAYNQIGKAVDHMYPGVPAPANSGRRVVASHDAALHPGGPNPASQTPPDPLLR
jgi:hypothetical protein